MPLPFVAGRDYFIGFRNVEGLGVNYTADIGATDVAYFWGGFIDDGSYGFGPTGGGHCQLCDPPILRFYGDDSTSVPEPASIVLLLSGAGYFIGKAWWTRSNHWNVS
jgi:hypothetical protein